MIQIFIKIANSLIGKIIFAAILFGMVFVWGIGGITETSRSTNSAIKVGGEKVSLKKLDEIFAVEREKFSKLTGKYVSPKEAIGMGLLSKVVQEQVEKMVLNGVKEELGLTATNAAIRRYVENHPAFQDVNGHFDRTIFMAYLRQMGLSEQGMAEQLQEELAIQHLNRALMGLGYAPKDMAKAAYAYQNEKRNITAVEIKADQLKIEKQPTEAELKDLYDIFAEDKFMTPEYRTFRYLKLTPADMVDRVIVSDDEIDVVLSERQAQFNVPEKREISQIFFKDQEAAEKALKGLNAKNFNEVAKKAGQEKPSFGFVAENELMEELAEVAFKAKKGDIVGPVESMTGWHILWVRDIQKAQEMPIAEMRTKIKKQIAEEKSYAKMEETVRQLEDILGMGENLEKAGSELKIALHTVDTVDVAGKQKNGNTLTDDLNNKELLQSLFTLKVGESTPLFEGENSYIVAEVDKVTPVGMKTFDEVRSEVISLWKNNHKQEQLTQTVSDVLKRLEKGDSLVSQATFLNFPVIHENNLTRTGNDKINPNVAKKIFETTDKVIQVPTEVGVLIVQLNSVSKPDATDKELKTMQEELRQQIGQELYQEVIAGYAQDMGVNVNTEAIDKTFSVYQVE